MKQPENKVQTGLPSESGQSIVLIALLIVGLIAFAGVATDVGMLFARSSQYTAAVDAATLAGAVDLTESVDAAIARAGEFLAANGWPTSVLTGTQLTTGRGYPEFVLTATYSVPTYFLHVLGFDEVPVTRSAAAALYTQTDMPTSAQAELGMLRTAGQFVMGPDSCTAQGDPISARWRQDGVANPLRDFTGGRYIYRIQVPDDFSEDLVVQLFDPDPINTRFGNTTSFELSNGATVPSGTEACLSGGDGDACMISTGEPTSSNPVWLHRADEVWVPAAGCPVRSVDDPNGNTVTRYMLYYYDGADNRKELVAFTSGAATDTSTDMKWITPGIDFTANITARLTDRFRISTGILNSIPVDGSRNRSVYLDVEAIAGTSKNGWDVWAGPASVAATLPADANQRNLAILRNLRNVSTGGVEIFAQGYLPVTSYLFDPLTLPIAAISSAQGGGTIYATVFDFEAPASGPFQFNFDTMSLTDRPGHGMEIGQDPGLPQNLLGYNRYPLCSGGGDCNNRWVEPQFNILIPSSSSAYFPRPFYGGYLTVDYTMHSDEHVWSVSLAGGRPFLTR